MIVGLNIKNLKIVFVLVELKYYKLISAKYKLKNICGGTVII